MQRVASLEEDAADYDASEVSTAAYGMVDLDLRSRGPRSSRLRAGMRYERISSRYSGFEVRVAGDGANGDGAATRTFSGGREYGNLLPMAQLATELSPRFTLVADVSRTF